MMRMTRVSKDQRPLLVDERDERIARQASSYAFVSLLAFIYLVCILLHLSYEESGWMPVGWMWFLGYSSIFMGYVLHSIIYLMLDSRMILYGES